MRSFECFEMTKNYKCRRSEGELSVEAKEAYPGEFPHVAAIGWEKAFGIEFQCTGSLISERFVLTVRNCVMNEL